MLVELMKSLTDVLGSQLIFLHFTYLAIVLKQMFLS